MDMVRFAVVGTSAITARFLDALALEQGAALHAVYSRTKQRAQAFGAQYGARAYYDSLQALAADENVDAVYIASPNSLHCAQALCMLRAGKHVLCEKPMAATARQARQMFTAAEENGVVLMEAMRSLYAPGFARLRGLVQAVGPVRRATLSYSKYSSRYELVRRGEPTNIFSTELATGALMDLGVYCVHLALGLFGAPQSLRAAAVKLANGADGAGTILACYEDKLAELLYSKITDGCLPGQIQGEQGTILVHHPDNITRLEVLWRDGRREDIRIQNPPNNMCGEVRHFLHLLGGAPGYEEAKSRTLAALALMDEARRQTGLRFPADEAYTRVPVRGGNNGREKEGRQNGKRHKEGYPPCRAGFGRHGVHRRKNHHPRHKGRHCTRRPRGRGRAACDGPPAQRPARRGAGHPRRALCHHLERCYVRRPRRRQGAGAPCHG